MTTATATGDEANTIADTLTYPYTDSSADSFALILMVECGVSGRLSLPVAASIEWLHVVPCGCLGSVVDCGCLWRLGLTGCLWLPVQIQIQIQI